MTAVRDRRDELDKPRDGASARPGKGGDARSSWGQQMAFGQANGVPWWGAVIVALALAIVGALINHAMTGEFGIVFQGAYFIGCVGAICLARRQNMFAPMVQPPLILAISVPLVGLIVGGGNGGMKAKLITIGTSLINQFPVMAITTVITVGIGVARVYLQKRPATRAASPRPTGGSGRAPARHGQRSGSGTASQARPGAAGATAAGAAGAAGAAAT
ncbi:DUF6542 domain-containing protein, partial [Sciscionella sediminilitoris]|uniref:DUF6542 domain-containing protein n=1 Tax=Sciscionella sediminilitoris TaxID=1445613 RepID=UPI0031B5C6F7